MTQKQKLEELRKRGYSRVDVQEHAAEHTIPFNTAVYCLFDYECKFTAKQETMELGELEVNPFQKTDQGDLF